MLHGRLGQLLFTPKEFKACSKVTELRSPVTKIVDSLHVVTEGVEDASEAVAEDGRTQVTSVEGLGDVWRAELDEDCLVLFDSAKIGRLVFVVGIVKMVAMENTVESVIGALSVHTSKHFLKTRN